MLLQPASAGPEVSAASSRLIRIEGPPAIDIIEGCGGTYHGPDHAEKAHQACYQAIRWMEPHPVAPWAGGGQCRRIGEPKRPRSKCRAPALRSTDRLWQGQPPEALAEVTGTAESRENPLASASPCPRKRAAASPVRLCRRHALARSMGRDPDHPVDRHVTR
jgi:hypothetical protein